MNFDPYWKWLGIPPDEQPADHYRLLGIVPFESDEEVIGNAADRQMLHVRTFQSGTHSDLSQRLLNELAAARLTLLDPKKRAAYDAHLRALWAESPAGEAQPADAVPRDWLLPVSRATADSRDPSPGFPRRPASYWVRRKRRSTQGPWIVAATVAIVAVALLLWAFRQVLVISIPDSQPHQPSPSKAAQPRTHAKPQPDSTAP